MTRVSENSSFHSINYSVGKSRSKLEDLQLKGSNLKRVQKPSDDPNGNIDILTMRSRNVDMEQYLRNNSYARTQLAFTESALEELTDLMTKVKELAIGQASNLYAPEVRIAISKEIEQIRNQAFSIANRRIGNKFIFSGHKTLTKPFDEKGNYLGDNGKIHLELHKDFFIPINLTGAEVFLNKPLDKKEPKIVKPHEPTEELGEQEISINRDLASVEVEEERPNLFKDLQTFINALHTNNFEIVQTLLPRFDESIDKLVLLRAQIGALENSISNAEGNIEKSKVQNEDFRSKMEDADVAEIFTDLARQKSVLDATYKSSANLMNQSLLNFVK